MATTGQTIVDGALRLLGAIESGESPSTDESSDALEALNQLLASWYDEGIFIPSRIRESITLSSSAESYTIGSGGDINTSWPQVIESAYWRQNGVDYPMRFMDETEYSIISNKTTSSRPTRIYYEPSFPLGVIRFDYLPDLTYTLNLVSLKPLSDMTLTGDISLPGSYSRALKFNLAVEIAPEYGVAVSSAVISGAIQSKSAITTRMANSRTPELLTEFSANGRYDIFSDS